ncbi:pilus assembly protein N-terminal domain-containing protein [Candidatus Sumerlaeota bacterium]|nr:pilus assembly protein N-terminal domain-containing protein [Candidatus Sumerlaeota bacterium]
MYQNALFRLTALSGVCLLVCMLLSAPVNAQEGGAGGNLQEVNKGTINLLENQERTIKLVVRQIAVGNASIANATELPDRSGVLISGRSEGSTEVRLWPQDIPNTIYVYTVTVSKVDIGQLKEEIKQLLGSMLGVEVNQVGNRLVIDGQVFRSEDRARLDKIIEVYGLLDLTNNVFDEVEAKKKLEEMAKQEEALVAQIKADLAKMGYDGVEVEMKLVRGQRMLMLSGAVFNDDHKAAVMNICRIYYGEDGQITDLIKVENPVIELDVQYATVRQSNQLTVGDNNAWNSFFTGNAGDGWSYNTINWSMLDPTDPIALSRVSRIVEPTFVWGEGANTALRLLRTKDITKGYAEQAQVVKSGQKGRFNQGGELYFTTQGENPSLQSVEYGFTVEVTPVLEVGEMVSTKVNLEKSVPVEQDPGITDEAVLSIDKVESESTIDVQSGVSIVLAGIDDNQKGRADNETPFLSAIPIVNLFFRARGDSSEFLRTFLVVTPTKVKQYQKSNPDITSYAQDDLGSTAVDTETNEQAKERKLGNSEPFNADEKYRDATRVIKWWNPFSWH